MEHSNTTSMTQGSILKQLLFFSIPLLLGNLFQQFYSTVDSVIIGNFVGDGALAAVNSSDSVIYLFIHFFIGLSVGAGVVIANRYGAKDYENLSKSIHTAMALTLVASIALTIIGYLSIPFILDIMNVDPDVLHDSTIYLQTYFLGSFGIITYNMGSGILRAVGDSRRPLYILIIACIINIVLDLIFVAVFKWGVFGVALATSIAQVTSAILVLLILINTNDIYQLKVSKIKFHKDSLSEIIRIGMPSAIQNMIISLSNAIVQSNINTFGKHAMAGVGSYGKIDGFAILPVISFSNALTTFVSQNIGAKEYDRVKKSVRVGITLSCSVVLFITSILFLFTHQILTLFSSNSVVIDYGTTMMKYMAPGYIILAISHNLSGILQGAGQTKTSMMILAFSWCICRIVWIMITVAIFHDIRFVFMGWPVSWFISMIIMLLYFRKGTWLYKR